MISRLISGGNSTIVCSAGTLPCGAAAALEAHYPERCDACVVLNAPPVFSFLLKLARPLVDPITMAKVHFP